MQHNNSFRAPQKRSFHSGNNRSGGFRPQRSSNRGPKKQTIHPSKFINRATERPEEAPYESKHQFSDFALPERLQNNLKDLGFVKPSPIQDQTIALALEGKNVVGLANTGTGKTAAFLLPILERLNKGDDRNSVLIMAPTRELAQQIDDEFRRFSRGMDLYAVTCVGGMNIERQIRDLRRRPHIIIGTPGRLKDLLKRRVLELDNISTLVLDEVDRMLDMGFVNEIRELVKLLPKDRRTLFFSATMTPNIQSIIGEMVPEYELVSVKTSETSQHIDQDVIMFDGKDHKLEVLKNILRDNLDQKILVFGETKFGVQRLADALSNDDIPAAAIHGNKSQSQRQRALDAFKANKVKVLIATDVAARGLDIADVSHVINFDQPQTYDDYVHRIGRTGRAGKTGKALTFVAGPSRHQ